MDQNTNYQQQPQKSYQGMSIAAMTCGILSIIPGLCLYFIGFPLAVVAIVLGAIAKSKTRPESGMAVAGLITGILSIALFISIIIIRLYYEFL